MIWRWFVALGGLVGCDDPAPPILAFESGTTSELGPLHLRGPSEDLLVFGFDEELGFEALIEERLESTEIADVIIDDQVLDGETAIRLGGEVGTLAIEIDRPELVGRRTEFRFWQRPEGTRIEAQLHWIVGDVPVEEDLWAPFVLSALRQQGRIVNLGVIEFLPTGRRTPQGWEEWTSGPVDFAFGGVAHLTPLLVFRDVAMDHASRTGGVIRTSRTAVLDALQVVDLGKAAVPERTCRLADEASRCGRKGACALGRCVDAAARFGRFPSDEGVRTDLSERRARELDHWSGSRQPRDETLAESVEAIRDLGAPRTTARTWWLEIAAAFRDLQDGHSVHGRSLAPYGSGGLCLDLGEADLLRLEEPHPLVTHHFGTAPWEGVIALGDVLVEVDGEPANRWLEDHSTPLVGSTGRSGFQQVSDVTRSMSAAVAAGSLLTFERCPNVAPCEDTARRVEVDLAEVAAGVWEPDAEIPPLLVPPPRACDHRLDPVVANDESRARQTFDFGRRRRVPVLQLNGFADPFVADVVLGAVEDALVIDARAGAGGSILAELSLAGLFTSEADMLGIRFDPWFERQPDEAKLAACVRDGDWCFGSDYFGFEISVSELAVLRDIDVVLLNHRAVSANDLLSLHLQERCTGDPATCGTTTLIGGADSAGGFSPPLTGPGYLGSDRGAGLTPYDTKLIYSEELASDYLVGTPVMMDEYVLQTQSDAMNGVDTQLEAALEAIP
ncbi:MAG: hypothetical protein AAGA48_03410 [Myxococcota bacterium]